ncbi:MAG TPA: GNAT family N-acetyltransferase [Bacteroidetes bacterium]|nr:GNAT family N-acetyltransferase [Bacteroidota bacterium]
MSRTKKSDQILIIHVIINSIPAFSHKTTTKEIHQRIKEKDHDFIIVEDNNKPTGFLIAYALDKETYYNWLMGVLPEFRRKGYGRQLIKKFETIAGDKGYTAVQVKTMEKFFAMRHLLAEMKYQKIGQDEEGKFILRKNL